MKIIIIEQCNTSKGVKKSYRAGVFGKNIEAFAHSEVIALKRLVKKIETIDEKWIQHPTN